jgi:toxin-antitoxin system PIN domain toxin
MRSLLDVNVLVAILDLQHEHNRRARDWLGQHGIEGWASCPITENGCVRVLSHHKYPGGGTTPEKAIELLRNLINLGNHEFWVDDVSLMNRNIIDRSRIQGPKQITDVYLLALASGHGGRLVTLDGGIAMNALREGKAECLLMI